MTIYISHRGNITNPNPSKENHPDYISEALHQGYQVEIDLWYQNGFFVLGHDEPQYQIDKLFLQKRGLWIHCKNISALNELMKKSIFYNCFFHDQDDCVLTSKNWIWVYPGKPVLSQRCIAVLPEKVENWNWRIAGGICTDYPKLYKEGGKV